MMDRLEKVELIREKTGVSYDDAQAALAANNDDVLDAIVWLERLGKVETTAARHTTAAEAGSPISAEMVAAQESYERASKKTKIGTLVERLLSVIERLCRKGLDTTFVVERRGERIVALPVLMLVIGILVWWVTLPLLIVGLFLECHYRFEGVENVTVNLNDMMDAASEGATTLKDSFKKDE